MCVNAWEDEGWADRVLARMVAQPVTKGWPVDTLVANKTNGRRGRIHSSYGERCAIEFTDNKSPWPTTWSVVLRNYTKI